MKDYKDMAEQVLRRRDRYQAERKKQMRRAVSAVSCFCLAVLLGAGLWRGGALLNGTGDVMPGGVPVGNSGDPGAVPTADGGDRALRVVINRLDAAPAAADMDVRYDSCEKLPYDVWKAVMEKFHTETGIEFDAFLDRIPAEFRDNSNFFSLSTRGYKDAGRDENYLLHDYVFECCNDGGAKIVIALCGFEQPLRDVLIPSDGLTESRINGTAVTVCGYENTYWARFTCRGVNYDVETRDLDQAGLEALLAGLLAE